MAFKVSADAQTVFFTKVFGPSHPVVDKVKALVANGVTFEVALYTVRAYHLKDNQPAHIKLTVGTSALMKGTVDPAVAIQNRKLIDGWITLLFEKQGSPVVPEATVTVFPPAKVVVKLTPNGKPNLIQLIKAIRSVTGLGLYEAKIAGEQVIAGEAVSLAVVSMTAEGALKAFTGVFGVDCFVVMPEYPSNVSVPVIPVAAKPVSAVIKLKDAKALGQKVHGTSTGSVYHCIALTDHVKVAARLYKSGSISIRAEWTDNPKDELKKLAEAGVQMKAEYGSVHFDAADVPLQRVIGAFLVGTGISWKAAVMNGAELVIGEKA